MEADPSLTENIRIGRSFSKQDKGFCSLLQMMHGDDWERVLDADTEAIIGHADISGNFFIALFPALTEKCF